MQPVLSQSSSNLSPEENMEYPILVLTQQPDSHNFNERRILLNETIKIGRSVARARPCESNAIFDCKVLSRNHAIFWFDNGKVWLKDTKSSNGTFVNSQLLSKGTEDSPPREIYSGDIIQFGVEVVENTTTHGCIIAQTTVFLSSGTELRRHSEVGGIANGIVPISNYYEEQIYQLAQYIQEASHREQTLEKKLTSLSQLILDTQEASDSSWKVILNQDRLMEKLELLQEQVDMRSKDDEQDSLTLEFRRVLEQRYGLERESKTLLEGLIEEKADVLQRVVDLEQSLGASEEECSQLRLTLETLQCDHGDISALLSSGKDEVDSLQKKLKDAQMQYEGEISRLCADKAAMTTRYEQLRIEVADLRSRLDDAEQELAREHTDAILCKRDEARMLRDMLEQTSSRQADLDSSMLGIQSQLSRALITEILALQNLNELEDSMADSEMSLDSCIVGATSELGLHFIESHHQIRSSMELISLMRDELDRIQETIHGDNESSVFYEMGGLVERLDETQLRSKTLLTQIPEKLMDQVVRCCDIQGSISDNSVQTDVVSIEHCGVQHEDEINTESLSLDQSLDNLQLERNMVELLRMDLQQLQDENVILRKKSVNLADVIEEMRLEARQVSECGGNVLVNGDYDHLLEESDELRRRVQKIEDEMIEKRREYDTLYEQYEILISTQNNDQGEINAMRALCSRQEAEIEELRYSVSSRYRSVLARSRMLSALSVVPLIMLLFGIIISIVSFLGRPYLQSESP